MKYSDKLEHRNDRIENLGFDYQGKIFENTISKVITADPKRKKMLDKVEAILYELIESVKLIKTNINWTVKKDYKKIN